MSAYLNQLKTNRTKDLEKLTAELEKATGNNNRSNEEELYWKPTVDKAGNGSAVLRFLPAPPGETIPFVKLWSHAFQGPGGWYIENSRSTLNEDDPVGELNSRLWETGLESNKDIARKQKRKLSYISNVYIIRDPGNPENEGKVFYYKYGKKIFAMINDLLHPQFDDEEKINAFDLWEGANFKLQVTKVDNYPNYDKSRFDSKSPLLGGDEDKLEKVLRSMKSLSTLVTPDKFKSYDDLMKRLSRVLGAQQKTPNEREAEEAPALKSAPEKTVSPPWEAAGADDDDSVNFFKNLENITNS